MRLTTAARAKAVAGLDEVTRAALERAGEKVLEDGQPLEDNVVSLASGVEFGDDIGVPEGHPSSVLTATQGEGQAPDVALPGRHCRPGAQRVALSCCHSPQAVPVTSR